MQIAFESMNENQDSSKATYERVLETACELFPAKLERRSGSRRSCPVPIRVVRWQQVSFVPSVKHVCAIIPAPNQSQTFAAISS